VHVNIQRDISATFLDICKWTCSIASGGLGSGLLNPFAVLSFLSSVSPCCFEVNAGVFLSFGVFEPYHTQI
jgi:hypothetical protein